MSAVGGGRHATKHMHFQVYTVVLILQHAAKTRFNNADHEKKKARLSYICAAPTLLYCCTPQRRGSYLDVADVRHPRAVDGQTTVLQTGPRNVPALQDEASVRVLSPQKQSRAEHAAQTTTNKDETTIVIAVLLLLLEIRVAGKSRRILRHPPTKR